MVKNKYVDFSFPALCTIFGIYIIYCGSGMRAMDGYFPIIIGTMMAITSSVYLKNIYKNQKVVFDFNRINIRNIIKTVIVLMAYVSIFEKAGYFFSTFVLGIIISHLLGLKDYKQIILYPLFIVVVLFIVFKLLLRIYMPTLILNL